MCQPVTGRVMVLAFFYLWGKYFNEVGKMKKNQNKSQLLDPTGEGHLKVHEDSEVSEDDNKHCQT